MNPSSDPTPRWRTLYWNDSTIHGAVKTVFFALFVAGGFVWASQPIPDAHPSVDLTFEKEMAKWIPPIAVGVAAAAALVLAWRYWAVMRILRRGTIVRGVVQDLIVHGWKSGSASNRAGVANNRHAYWADRLRRAWREQDDQTQVAEFWNDFRSGKRSGNGFVGVVLGAHETAPPGGVFAKRIILTWERQDSCPSGRLRGRTLTPHLSLRRNPSSSEDEGVAGGICERMCAFLIGLGRTHPVPGTGARVD